MKNSPPGLDTELTVAIINTLREPIVILDGELRVTAANRAFLDAFQVTPDAVRGKAFYELEEGGWDVPPLRVLLEQLISQKTMIEGYEVEHAFEKRGLRTMHIYARPIRFGEGPESIIVSIADVTEARVAERDRERLMLQKDTLLKEMRHRIANSLQLIASIILLKADSVKSDESKRHLQDAHDRIISVATVQRNLDPVSAGSMVPVVTYLQILCESIARSMIGGRKPISIKVAGGPAAVTPDEAISLGLITTELVMNALKHAFPKGEGQVTVTYTSDANGWKLTIGDDGIGLSAGNMANREGLGTSIVESLATQLDATVRRKSTARGTIVSILSSGHLKQHPLQDEASSA